FLDAGNEVVTIDDFQTGYRAPTELLKKQYGDKYRVYEQNLMSDLSPFFEKEKNISAVVHYAASCVVDESMKNPYKYFNNNVQGSLNLVDTILKFGINKIVFSSTCAVYGDVKTVPITENTPPEPNNTYGESKHFIERILHWYSELKGLNYAILRYFNVCGATADGEIGYSKNPSTHLPENAVKGALKLSPFYLTYQQVDTPDGSPIRDYVHVVDLNKAHMKAVDYLINGGKSEIINLGTGTGYSVLEMVNKIKELTGAEFPVEVATERRTGESPKLVADITKAGKVLGWKPESTLKDTIDSSIAWYNKHPKGWTS
ncbi:MAG: UDP-glucose 4-epimerase GalE, partial [Patescibacteria group bacterium]